MILFFMPCIIVKAYAMCVVIIGTRRAPWQLPTPPEIGCVSCIARPPVNSNSASCATATAWVSAATNRGFLALWDLRCVRLWTVVLGILANLWL